jgi:hypothetical protein
MGRHGLTLAQLERRHAEYAVDGDRRRLPGVHAGGLKDFLHSMAPGQCKRAGIALRHIKINSRADCMRRQCSEQFVGDGLIIGKQWTDLVSLAAPADLAISGQFAAAHADAPGCLRLPDPALQEPLSWRLEYGAVVLQERIKRNMGKGFCLSGG